MTQAQADNIYRLMKNQIPDRWLDEILPDWFDPECKTWSVIRKKPKAGKKKGKS